MKETRRGDNPSSKRFAVEVIDSAEKHTMHWLANPEGQVEENSPDISISHLANESSKCSHTC